jgi:hypothetical protein
MQASERLARACCQMSPEGRCDRSLARSAWKNAIQKSRPVGYGVIEYLGRKNCYSTFAPSSHRRTPSLSASARWSRRSMDGRGTAWQENRITSSPSSRRRPVMAIGASSAARRSASWDKATSSSGSVAVFLAVSTGTPARKRILPPAIEPECLRCGSRVRWK